MIVGFIFTVVTLVRRLWADEEDAAQRPRARGGKPAPSTRQSRPPRDHRESTSPTALRGNLRNSAAHTDYDSAGLGRNSRAPSQEQGQSSAPSTEFERRRNTRMSAKDSAYDSAPRCRPHWASSQERIEIPDWKTSPPVGESYFSAPIGQRTSSSEADELVRPRQTNSSSQASAALFGLGTSISNSEGAIAWHDPITADNRLVSSFTVTDGSTSAPTARYSSVMANFIVSARTSSRGGEQRDSAGSAGGAARGTQEKKAAPRRFEKQPSSGSRYFAEIIRRQSTSSQNDSSAPCTPCTPLGVPITPCTPCTRIEPI